MALRRYDVCLLPVRPSTLSWARTSLAQASRRLHTPLIAMASNLTTAGLYDLHELGVADFLRDPFCSHEARMRIERLLDGRRLPVGQATVHNVADGGAASSYSDDPVFKSMCANILNQDGKDIETYAISAASRCSRSKESFRDAKSNVINRFEQAYITASLSRHGGNIAMAARSAQKHRRAFWALMRKHDISADPFRAQSHAQALPSDPQKAGAAGTPGVAGSGHSSAYLGRFRVGGGGGGPFKDGGG